MLDFVNKQKLTEVRMTFKSVAVYENDIAFAVSTTVAHIRKNKSLPFDVGLQLFDDPLTVEDRWLNLFFYWSQHVRWNLS